MRLSTTTVNVRKLWRAGCAMALLCFQTNVSLAAPLAPGGSIAAPPELDPVGGLLLHTISSPFATPSFTGTLISSVYTNDTSNPFGSPDLTFTYELIMGSGPDSASAVSIGSFAGFQTDVSYQVPSIGLAPGTISRNPLGSQAVKFDFSGVGFLTPGQNSALLVVQTDSTAWGFGNATVLDNNGSPNIAALTPVSVPEPASVGLVVLGLGVLAGYQRWKRRTSAS
jgi:hypothetical protein